MRYNDPMETYQIDPSHTKVHFSVKHMMLSKVHGDFHELNGSLDYDPVNPARSEVYVAIKAKSITTNNSERDEAVLGPQFLDVENNPFITFRSKKILEKDAGDRSKWELLTTVPMRFNRLVLLRPWLWHTSGPGFGNSVENGRLIYVMFFWRAQ